MLAVLLLFITPLFAEDILLDLSEPVFFDKKIRVATYYRNEPNFYYFTIVYKLKKKFYSRITFNITDAALSHRKAEFWARKASLEARLYSGGDLEISPERFEIVPRAELYQGPFALAFQQSEGEVYWIYPQNPENLPRMKRRKQFSLNEEEKSLTMN